MSFLDIDTILAEEERLPCTFKYDAEKLGFLDPTNEEDTVLPASSKVELPVWLAKVLLGNRMIEFEMPKHFAVKMRNELASASSVNLRDYSNYFFDVGLELSKITRDNDLLRTLRTTFCGPRYRTLINSLTNAQEDSTEDGQNLTHSERSIFNAGQHAAVDISDWRSNRGHILKSTSLISRKSIGGRSSIEGDLKRLKGGF